MFRQRALSDSEVQAIYATQGHVNKPKSDLILPFQQSLASARVGITGVGTNTIHADNTNWTLNTVTFTAPQDNSVLQIDGLSSRGCCWIRLR